MLRRDSIAMRAASRALVCDGAAGSAASLSHACGSSVMCLYWSCGRATVDVRQLDERRKFWRGVDLTAPRWVCVHASGECSEARDRLAE